jgi:sec-independent protein translocase protein TatA
MGLIGWPELIIILVIVVMIFGAGRITELSKALGQGIKEYKNATAEQPKVKDEDPIREAAIKMGIQVDNKSTNQLLDEMAKHKI